MKDYKAISKKQAGMIEKYKDSVHAYKIGDWATIDKLESELSALQQESESEKFPDIDFREQIANELSRDELIERLCEMNKVYREMREEWFNVTQLRGEKIPEVQIITSTDYSDTSEEKLFILDLLRLNKSERTYTEEAVLNIINQVLKFKHPVESK